MTSDPKSALWDLIEKAVTAEGFDLESLDVSRVGRRGRVKVVVDSDEGVDLDQCAELSHKVSAILDANDDLMGDGPYTLEVSSPGVTRPLTLPRHWRRNIGRLVRVVLTDGDVVTGRVTAADEHEALLDVAGSTREVPYDKVGKAKVQVEFRRHRDDEK
ncbi:MAG TPA: ribosome maturation factor RimP [Jiangellaceae bacterium]|nr:ribosome maturation factor RimP [Jiangellaceae bacterium]